jgi:acyl carrier protein
MYPQCSERLREAVTSATAGIRQTRRENERKVQIMKQDTVTGEVTEAVAEAVGLDVGDVTGDSTLLGDLGAESIDLLDILFRLERVLGVKITAGELAEYVQGGISDEDFGDADEVITPAGLAQLSRVMPQIDVAALAGNLRADAVMGLFTVDNLITLVLDRLAETRLRADASVG